MNIYLKFYHICMMILCLFGLYIHLQFGNYHPRIFASFIWGFLFGIELSMLLYNVFEKDKK